MLKKAENHLKSQNNFPLVFQGSSHDKFRKRNTLIKKNILTSNTFRIINNYSSQNLQINIPDNNRNSINHLKSLAQVNLQPANTITNEEYKFSICYNRYFSSLRKLNHPLKETFTKLEEIRKLDNNITLNSCGDKKKGSTFIFKALSPKESCRKNKKENLRKDENSERSYLKFCILRNNALNNQFLDLNNDKGELPFKVLPKLLSSRKGNILQSHKDLKIIDRQPKHISKNIINRSNLDSRYTNSQNSFFGIVKSNFASTKLKLSKFNSSKHIEIPKISQNYSKTKELQINSDIANLKLIPELNIEEGQRNKSNEEVDKMFVSPQFDLNQKSFINDSKHSSSENKDENEFTFGYSKKFKI